MNVFPIIPQSPCTAYGDGRGEQSREGACLPCVLGSTGGRCSSPSAGSLWPVTVWSQMMEYQRHSQWDTSNGGKITWAIPGDMRCLRPEKPHPLVLWTIFIAKPDTEQVQLTSLPSPAIPHSPLHLRYVPPTGPITGGPL